MTTHALLAALILTPTIGYAAWYSLKCWLAPFGHCKRCNGVGRTGRKLRTTCRRCRGVGRRLRIGRRIATYLRRTHAGSNR